VTNSFLPMRFAIIDVEIDRRRSRPTRSSRSPRCCSRTARSGRRPNSAGWSARAFRSRRAASAVHHLTLQDVCQAPSWDEVLGDFIDAHRDVDVLRGAQRRLRARARRRGAAGRSALDLHDARPRCAHGPTRRPSITGTLRYWRNPAGIERLIANQSHRAWPDAYVTAHLLRELLAEHDAETLIRWSEEPAMPPRLDFRQAPRTSGLGCSAALILSLQWIAEKSDLDEDTKLCAKRHHSAPVPGALIQRETYVVVRPEGHCRQGCHVRDRPRAHGGAMQGRRRLQSTELSRAPRNMRALVDACRQRKDALRPIA
jgi:hypothetical protein